jgi:hypothetical protein
MVNIDNFIRYIIKNKFVSFNRMIGAEQNCIVNCSFRKLLTENVKVRKCNIPFIEQYYLLKSINDKSYIGAWLSYFINKLDLTKLFLWNIAL